MCFRILEFSFPPLTWNIKNSFKKHSRETLHVSLKYLKSIISNIKNFSNISTFISIESWELTLQLHPQWTIIVAAVVWAIVQYEYE